jgi:hypothetical protein
MRNGVSLIFVWLLLSYKYIPVIAHIICITLYFCFCRTLTFISVTVMSTVSVSECSKRSTILSSGVVTGKRETHEMSSTPVKFDYFAVEGKCVVWRQYWT